MIFQTTAPTVTYTPEHTAPAPVDIPPIPLGGALIRTLGCGLCGTDVEKIQQRKVPTGSVLGHEVVGEIAELDAAYPGDYIIGQRLAIAHHVPCGACHYCVNESPSMCTAFKESNLFPGAFSPYFVVSSEHLAHTSFPIPNHISNREAANMEPLACVLRAIRRTPLSKQNGSVAVIGLGYIGMLLSQSLQIQNQRVLGLDLNPQRLGMASSLDFADAALHPTEHTREIDLWLRSTDVGRVDAVFMSVVNTHTMALALTLVRNGGSIMMMAGNTAGNIVDPKVLYYREINLLTSYSPSLQDLTEAHRMICEREISLTPIITHPLPVEKFNEGFDAYVNGEAIKVFYEYPKT